MKTQITFQFDTPEEAIAWMAKALLDDKKPKAPAAPARPQTATASTPAAEVPKRGPGRPPKKAAAAPALAMSDAGKKPGDEPTPAAAPTTPAPAKNPPTEEVSSAVQTPAAGVPQPADVVAALQRVLSSKAGMPGAQAIFKVHGVKRGAEVKPEDRTAFIAYCDKVAKGEVDPMKGEA